MMNWPNFFTLIRFVAIIPIIGLFYVGDAWAMQLAFGLYAVASISDWLDGFLARKLQQFTLIGKVMDSIGDKLLVASTLVMLVGFGYFKGWQILAAAIMVMRELLISGLREFLAPLNVPLPITPLARWKATIQMVALGFFIALGGWPILATQTIVMLAANLVLLAAVALTIITGTGYCRQAWAVLKKG
ncbi:MAG: CDP-diacylglycerol--glycerol-3-phosphate 3-phosphatidyltransferase [Alphaproteobacteria bacterium]